MALIAHTTSITSHVHPTTVGFASTIDLRRPRGRHLKWTPQGTSGIKCISEALYARMEGIWLAHRTRCEWLVSPYSLPCTRRSYLTRFPLASNFDVTIDGELNKIYKNAAIDPPGLVGFAGAALLWLEGRASVDPRGRNSKLELEHVAWTPDLVHRVLDNLTYRLKARLLSFLYPPTRRYVHRRERTFCFSHGPPDIGALLPKWQRLFLPQTHR